MSPGSMRSGRRPYPVQGVAFRGTVLQKADILEIRQLIRLHGDRTQTEIARRVCRHFRWYLPSGGLADRSFLDVLRRLATRGYLRLPPSRRRATREPSYESDASSEVGWPTDAGPRPRSQVQELVVRPIEAGERHAWRQFIERYHYLGYRRLFGEHLCYVALLEGHVVALIGWAVAALKNTPRDAYIGWDSSTKERRLSRVVNNTRFLMVPGAFGHNLASRVLAMNLRRLPRDWQLRYGHPVYLAETFVDTTRFRGTCYRASNWIELGRTSGWSRDGTTYRRNGTPKTVFVYPLHRRARQLLNASADPARQHKEARPLTLDPSQLPLEGEGGLIDVLRTIVDFRKRRGIRHSVGSVVAFAACATLAGMRSFAAVAEWAKDQPRNIRDRLGCTRHSPASESCFRRVLSGVDAQKIDEKVGRWLEGQVSVKGERLALDGKTLRGSADGESPPVHLLSALLHREGIVVAQVRVESHTNEIPCVEPLLKPLSMEGAVVTADALHAQKETAKHIVEQKQADYVFTVKDNQPTLRKDIEDLDLRSFSPSGPQAETVDKGHGRLETRQIWTSTDLNQYVDFPHCGQVFEIARSIRKLNGELVSQEVVQGISSLTPERASPSTLLEIVRGHWAIENRLHWVRDVTFDEDRSQVRKGTGPQTMATLRNLAISVLRLAGAKGIAATLRYYQRHGSETLRLIGL